jgi:hypothetical protein
MSPPVGIKSSGITTGMVANGLETTGVEEREN